MKFLHISDIHLGKRPFGCSLREDHEHILSQILALAGRADISAVLIAGDIYNRAQPQPDSITQFSSFLVALSRLDKPVFIIRGNHDGEAQLAYASPLLAASNLHLSEIFAGTLTSFTLSDEHGPIHVHLLPFIKPAQTRRFFPDEKIETYADAVSAVLSHSEIDTSARNILITHQYVLGAQTSDSVLGAQTSDSEERSIGGVDQIPPSVFDFFDYVALGHLHKSQTMAGGRIRYCGAPLVYAFDECDQQKSATVVTIGEKGSANEFELVPFQPLHPCRRIEGTLAELCAMPRSEDYIEALLTDSVRPLDAVGSLKITFPNLLHHQFIHLDSGEMNIEEQAFEPSLSPLEHFEAFYTVQNGFSPSEEQLALVREIIQEGENEA